MVEKQERGGDGKIVLAELEKYAELKVDPELVKALADVDPKAVEAAIKADKQARAKDGMLRKDGPAGA